MKKQKIEYRTLDIRAISYAEYTYQKTLSIGVILQILSQPALSYEEYDSWVTEMQKVSRYKMITCDKYNSQVEKTNKKYFKNIRIIDKI